MQAYKLVVPEGVQVGDVVWVSFDPRTCTATCVPDHEVKEREREALDRLIPVVGNRAMSLKLGPHEALWPEVVRLASQRDPPAAVHFVNYDLNPEAFWTRDPLYDALPKNVEASSQIWYAACYTAVGQESEQRRFLQAMNRTGWIRVGRLSAMGRRIDLFWAKGKPGPIEERGPAWAVWQESSYWKIGNQPYGVYSFCAPQRSAIRISVRKNGEGTPIAALVTDGHKAAETIALTVHTKPTADELPL